MVLEAPHIFILFLHGRHGAKKVYSGLQMKRFMADDCIRNMNQTQLLFHPSYRFLVLKGVPNKTVLQVFSLCFLLALGYTFIIHI